MFRMIAVALLCMPVLPLSAGENCTCRYEDADIAEGSTICMRSPGGSRMAKCVRVLNNTSWKFLEEPCPVS